MRNVATQPVTDSPWFWVYLFATFALIGLVLVQSKFESRQAGIERRGVGRLAGGGAKSAQEIRGESETSRSPENSVRVIDSTTDQHPLRTVSLRPLYIVLSGMVGVGWILFWLQRRSRLSRIVVSESETTSDNRSDNAQEEMESKTS